VNGQFSQLDELLSQTRALLSTTADSSDEPTNERDESAVFEGWDADRTVHAVLSASGRLTSIEVSDRAVRGGSVEVSQRAVAAVNAALAEWESRSVGRSGLGEVDPDKLTALQDASTAALSDLAGSLTSLMNSFRA
jgi:hypothetical protein